MNNNKNFTSIEIPLIKKLYELYKYAHKSISVFPKHERYSLGEKIEGNILEAIELSVFGNAQPKNFKEAYLLKANAKVEVLKILFRLALGNNFINETQYLKVEDFLHEAGKMLGGWIKYLRSDFVEYGKKDKKRSTEEVSAKLRERRRPRLSFEFEESLALTFNCRESGFQPEPTTREPELRLL